MEEKINLCIDLLEVAKTYCEFNYDKSSELSSVGSLISIILDLEKELANEYDESFMPNLIKQK